ncbi:MAG: potassium transporter [Thermodesulfobacteriota bacterium]
MKQDRRALRNRGTAVLVAGTGRFGSRALRELRGRHPRWKLLAVDKKMEALQFWTGQGVETHPGDAVEILDAVMGRSPPRWVVAAVPFHLAHAWLMYRLSSRGRGAQKIPVPGDLPVPNPILGATGDLYASYATFLCPEHCPEPRGRCSVTGEERPMPLFRLLSRLRPSGYTVIGIRSYQLAPGVGGCRAEEMMGLCEAVEAAAGDLLVYTACRCHGVLSGLRVGPWR